MAILQFKVKSECLESKSDVIVILPTPAVDILKEIPNYGFYQDGKKYQTLYLFHGTTGDCADWTRFSRIESYAQEHMLAVVMSSVQNSNFHNIPGSYRYFDYVCDELPTIMNWTFPLSRKRENTFIAGLSMGGSGAFKCGMARPERFSAVACLSGGFQIHQIIEGGYGNSEVPWAAAYRPGEVLTGTPEDPFWQAEQIMKDGVRYPALYLCCGTDDPICYEANLAFKRHLDHIGMRYTYHEQPGTHDWDFWDDEIRRVLDWLPLKNGLVDEEQLPLR